MTAESPLPTAPGERRVVVTGALGGIGRAIVEALAACGCTLGVCDVEIPEELPFDPEVSARVGGRAAFDVSDPAAVEEGITTLVDVLGGCDALVANAGVVDTVHRAERFPAEDWQKDLDTNLSGQFNVARAAFPFLEESGDGRIVLISSASAETGLPGQVAYTAAKAGVVGMARTLAAEWGSRGVRVNVVMPGMIATPKVKALPDALKEGIAGALPLGRIGDPSELAGAVTFLLSPAAGYMTGAVLRVDGGFGLAGGGLYRG